MHSFELIINLIVIGLLIPAIFYARRLNQNLNQLRQNQNSLVDLVRSLNEATDKAETSIPKLKTATQSTSGELKAVVSSAQTLKDDLIFINERADNLADRLETVIHNGRQMKNNAAENQPAPAAGKETLTASAEEEALISSARSEAEKELLQALRSIK